MIPQIIKDPNRARENTTLLKELKDQRIVPMYWNSVPDPQNVVRSINLSHKQIVRFAKKNHIPRICILEEDVMFTAPGAWLHFLNNIPKEYDLYLGGAYGLNRMAIKRISEETSNPTPEIHNFAGLHCYIIHERYYDRFLDQPENQHIDNQPGRGVFKVVYPFCALQHPGWSANNKCEQDYNQYYTQIDLYGTTR